MQIEKQFLKLYNKKKKKKQKRNRDENQAEKSSSLAHISSSKKIAGYCASSTECSDKSKKNYNKII